MLGLRNGYLQFRNLPSRPFIGYATTRCYAMICYDPVYEFDAHESDRQNNHRIIKKLKERHQASLYHVRPTHNSYSKTFYHATHLASTQPDKTVLIHTPQPSPRPRNDLPALTRSNTPTAYNPLPPLTPIMNNLIIGPNSHNTIPQPLVTDPTNPLLTNHDPAIPPALSTGHPIPKQ